MSRRSAIIYMGSIGVVIAASAAVRGTGSFEGSHDVVNKSEPSIQQAQQRKSGMFKGKEAAIEISKLMLALGAQLNGSLIRVQERCPSSEFEAYRAVLPASFACFQAPLMSNDRRHTSGTEVLI